MTERRIIDLTPQEVMYYAFDYLNKAEIERAELLEFAVRMGCPSQEIAEAVLNNMYQEGMITFRKVRGKIYFSRIEPKQSA